MCLLKKPVHHEGYEVHKGILALPFLTGKLCQQLHCWQAAVQLPPHLGVLQKINRSLAEFSQKEHTLALVGVARGENEFYSEVSVNSVATQGITYARDQI